jgi:hypothetical protein
MHFCPRNCKCIYLYNIHTSNPRPWGPVGVPIRVEAKLFHFFSSQRSCFLVYLMLCHIHVFRQRRYQGRCHLIGIPTFSIQSCTGMDPLIPVTAGSGVDSFSVLLPDWPHAGQNGLTGCRIVLHFGMLKNWTTVQLAWSLAQKMCSVYLRRVQ